MTSVSQVHRKTAAEVRLVSVDYRGKLDNGELLTGTPSVSILPTGPTIANESVNSAALTINGQSVAIGQAAQFKISGGTAGTKYTITVKCDTDSTPAQEDLEATLILWVD